jgi:hypothetical protein
MSKSSIIPERGLPASTRLSSSLAGAILSLFLVTGAAPVGAQDVLSPPNWPDLFSENGTLKDVVDENGAAVSNGVPDYVDLYGGIDAVFVGDNISDGVAVDMTALLNAESLADSAVHNSTVSPAHDVGNAFVFATNDYQNNLVIYGSVEHIVPDSESSYVEFEFLQDIVKVRQGNPWPIHGERTVGDLVLRLNLDQGVLASVEVKRWTSEGAFVTISSSVASGGVECNGPADLYIACDPWLQSGQFLYESSFDPINDSWDTENNLITLPTPNALLEFGINVGGLLNTNPAFKSVIVRTPEDIIIEHLGIAERS